VPSIAPKSPTVGDILPGKLGFGAAPLGNMLREIPESEALATVDTAWNDGIRNFDTAPFYGAGLAEIRMARRLPVDRATNMQSTPRWAGSSSRRSRM
jgi:D-threo-aldose 1-dehydrogenase